MVDYKALQTQKNDLVMTNNCFAAPYLFSSYFRD